MGNTVGTLTVLGYCLAGAGVFCCIVAASMCICRRHGGEPAATSIATVEPRWSWALRPACSCLGSFLSDMVEDAAEMTLSKMDLAIIAISKYNLHLVRRGVHTLHVYRGGSIGGEGALSPPTFPRSMETPLSPPSIIAISISCCHDHYCHI